MQHFNYMSIICHSYRHNCSISKSYIIFLHIASCHYQHLHLSNLHFFLQIKKKKSVQLRFANEQRQPGEGKQERWGRVEGEGEGDKQQQNTSFAQKGLVFPPTKLDVSKFAS